MSRVQTDHTRYRKKPAIEWRAHVANDDDEPHGNSEEAEREQRRAEVKLAEVGFLSRRFDWERI